MCLAVPGKILDIDRSAQPVMGTVSFGGIRKKVCLEWLPEAGVGDYVIVHVGFALSKVDEEEALQTLKMFEEMGAGLEELDERPDEEDRPPARRGGTKSGGREP
jgi:hydrogenase expression/formation protein HypC